MLVQVFRTVPSWTGTPIREQRDGAKWVMINGRFVKRKCKGQSYNVRVATGEKEPPKDYFTLIDNGYSPWAILAQSE